mmetsp:Transcript_54513/g.116462  ORF Transcript_54513/g.116462 Transcript_54513/m.116462 type:complete len:210 (-) Transcript_54513:848-1477(-)
MPRDRRRRRDVSTESYSYSDYSESRSPSPRKRKHRSSRKDRHKSSRRSGRDGGGDRRRGGGGGGGGGGKATDSNVDRFIEENELNPDAAARLRTADREVRERVLEQGWNVIDNARNASAVVISRIRKHEQEMGIAGPRGLGGGGGGGGGGRGGRGGALWIARSGGGTVGQGGETVGRGPPSLPCAEAEAAAVDAHVHWQAAPWESLARP